MHKIFVILSFSILLSTAAYNVGADHHIIVQTYHAPEAGFLSNSHLILGRTSSILIDAQFSVNESKNVVELIESSKKHLSTIVITHSHPDHYYGLETLGRHYSNANIIGDAHTMREVQKSIGHWMDIDETNRKYASTTTIQEGQLSLDGEKFIFLTVEKGESPANTTIYIPSIKALFIGDLASNDVHMWLAENNTERWLTHLQKVRRIGPIDSIYPGHGAKGNVFLISKAEKYIRDFQATVATSPDESSAIATMTALYPHYKMREILIGSIMSAMAQKKITNSKQKREQ